SVLMEMSRTRLDKVANLIDTIIQEENTLHNELVAKREIYASRTRWTQWLVIILGIIFFSIAFWRMSVEWRKRIAYEKQLKLKVRALEDQNMQLEAFSFVLSHQLQEPLRKLGLFSDKLGRFQ